MYNPIVYYFQAGLQFVSYVGVPVSVRNHPHLLTTLSQLEIIFINTCTLFPNMKIHFITDGSRSEKSVVDRSRALVPLVILSENQGSTM